MMSHQTLKGLPSSLGHHSQTHLGSPERREHRGHPNWGPRRRQMLRLTPTRDKGGGGTSWLTRHVIPTAEGMLWPNLPSVLRKDRMS